MSKTKNQKGKHPSIHIFETDIPKSLEDKIQKISIELLDLISKYKAKRNLWEVKLKGNDDPRKADFYAIIARLGMLDMIVADLDSFLQIL